MRADNKDIPDLIIKSLQGELNEAEAARLNEWLLADGHRKIMDKLQDQQFLQSELQSLHEFNVGAVDRWQQVKEQLFPGNTVVPMRRRTWWYAAAAILLLVSVSVILWLPDRKQQVATTDTQPQKNPNDVPPGKDGAILTLANGRQILLDSAANGTVAQEGNLAIVKQDGQLVYDHSPLATNHSPSFNTLTTPKGRQYQLSLPDGSKVWLNAASSITYPVAFTGGERKVSVTGEAYFEVKKDITKKFIVESGGVTTEVLGTHFNVNSYADDGKQRVTLLEGSVKTSMVNARPGEPVGRGQSSILKPGEQAQLTIDHSQPAYRTGRLTIHKNVDTEEAVAWVKGYFKFNSTDLKTIMRYIERWYDVQVIYKGNVPEVRITGEAPRNLSLASLIKVMQLSNVTCYIENDKLIIEP